MVGLDCDRFVTYGANLIKKDTSNEVRFAIICLYPFHHMGGMP